MNWLDKFKGKGERADGQGEGKLRPGRDREAGGTVVRPGAKPGPTIAKPGIRFQINHEVTVDLQIKSLLGSGGMGEVYLARQRLWGVDVALKIPNDEIVSDPENRHRIVREAEAWTELGLHPNIAYCYYAQPLGELLLLVIEYVDGGNLRDWIADGRCADLRTGLDLAIQFCHGLEHAHKKGLVHRDIKPENILLMKDGTLKITDFGIVSKKLASPETLESTGAVRRVAAGMTVAGIGTADYMAPEQWSDQGEIDLRADVFAFGICLYEMLCGGRPYPMTAGQRQEAPDPGRMRGGKGLPERLSGLMKRCVDWDRERRPAGAQEVRAELCAMYEEVVREPCPYAELPELTTLADDWNNRAMSYLALGREEDAEEAWQTALEADPRHPESTYNYGLHRWRAAKTTDQEILANLRGVAESDPSSWLPRYVIAQVHLERGDAEGARDELGKIEGDGVDRAEVVEARRAVEELTAPSQLECTFEGHSGWDIAVWPSADGRHLLSGTVDKALRLWELASGRCLLTFEGHTRPATSVCLVAAGGMLSLWDVQSGRCLRTWQRSYATSACLSLDERYALSGSWDKTLKLWDVESGRCIRTFEGHNEHVNSVWLSADRRYALSRGRDNSLKLWSVGEFRYRAKLRLGQVGGTAEIMAAAAQHETAVSNARLASAAEDLLKACQWLRIARHQPQYGRAAQAAREWAKLYLRLRRRGLLDCWRWGTWSARVTWISLDGLRALSKSDDSSVRLWEVESGRCLRAFEGYTPSWMSADERYALSMDGYNKLALWDLESGRCLRTLKGGSPFCVSADGRYVLSQGLYELKLWEVESGQCLRILKEPGGPVKEFCSVCLTADARFAISGSRDSTWDITSGQCLRTVYTLELWDMASGRSLHTIEGHTDRIGSVCLSADERYAASGSHDKTVRLWDLASGHCLRTFEGHSGEVNSVCLSADGRYAASGSDDKTVKLWDLVSGRCLRTLEHEAEVRFVVLRPDGQQLIAADTAGTVTTWFLDWDLEENELEDWDRGARPYLEVFLRAHQPYAAALPKDRRPTDDEVTLALTRQGRPQWSEDDFKGLLYMLGCAGYGWLRPAGVRRELERVTRAVLNEAQEQNLRRWQQSGAPKKWVIAHHCAWNEAEWCRLLEELATSEFWPMNPDRVGLVLEELKRSIQVPKAT